MKPHRNSLEHNPLSDAPYQNPCMMLNEQSLGRHSLGGAAYFNLNTVLNEQGPSRATLPLGCSEKCARISAFNLTDAKDKVVNPSSR
jgi:hypothetical protein